MSNETDFRPPSASVQAAEAKLDKLTKADWITDQGRRWMTAALDPFHDSPIRLEGLPDNATGLSVVKKIVQTVQITAPAGLADGDTWDCSVISWPELTTDGGVTYQCPGSAGQFTNCLFQSSISNYVGGVTYASVKTGARTLPAQVSGGINPDCSGLDFGESTNPPGDPCRAIARAFEIANTTSDLAKQGTVYCWQCPMEYQEALSEILLGTGGSLATPTTIYNKTVRWAPLPPTTLEEVSITMDSRMWEAAKGVYCVSRLDTATNYVQQASSLQTIYGTNLGSGDANAVSMPWNSNIWNGAQNNFAEAVVRSPFNLHGAYFVGLSKSTSLTLRAICFLEVFPQCTSDLVTLASPSCPLDSNCLDVYSEAIRRLPVGVPFDMNPLGEWFEDVVNTVAGLAAPALGAASMIFPEFAPILAPLGAGVGALNEMVLEPRAQKRRLKRKMKKQKKQLAIDQAKLAKDNKARLKTAPPQGGRRN